MERNRFVQISAAKLIPGMMAMFDLWSMPGLVLSNKLLNGQGERHISFLIILSDGSILIKHFLLQPWSKFRLVVDV